MFDGNATPSSAINLSQFVIQWCTNFLFVWCFRKFLSIPFICIILHRSYKTNHMKSTWWKTHFTNNNYHFFFTNPKHANLQLPTGIYGANIITILSLLCVLFYYIAVLQKKTTKNHINPRGANGKDILKHSDRDVFRNNIPKLWQKSVARLFVCKVKRLFLSVRKPLVFLTK